MHVMNMRLCCKFQSEVIHPFYAMVSDDPNGRRRRRGPPPRRGGGGGLCIHRAIDSIDVQFGVFGIRFFFCGVFLAPWPSFLTRGRAAVAGPAGTRGCHLSLAFSPLGVVGEVLLSKMPGSGRRSISNCALLCYIVRERIT